MVRTAVPDIYSGQMSVDCQIVGEVLGVPMGEIIAHIGNSAVSLLSGTSTASRQIYMPGNSVKQAVTVVRERLLACAAEQLDDNPGDLDMADSLVFVAIEPERAIPLAELAALCTAEGIHRSELAIFRALFTGLMDPETGEGRVFPNFTYGAQAVELAVDTETGEITALKSVGANDVSQAINSAAVDGQVEGGILMGQAYALTEDMLMVDGKVVTPSLSEYLILTPQGMPEIKLIILESCSGVGPFGANGIGEPSFAPIAPAIANAVTNAIGLRIFELPITVERVVNALKEAAGGQGHHQIGNGVISLMVSMEKRDVTSLSAVTSMSRL